MAVKTVKCPSCEAEQAIIRGEDNTMQCVFCGAQIPLPEYEEGEEMEYSYAEETDSPKTEPKGDPVQAVFVLNEEEVGNAFAVSGKIKERKYIIYIEVILMFMVGTVALVMNILGLLGKAGAKSPTPMMWLLVGMSYAMIPYILISPKRIRRKLVRQSTSGNQLELSIYENLFSVHIAGRDPEDDWQQEFDGSFGVICEKDLIVLTLANGQILAIPERCLTEGEVLLVKERLTSVNGK